eukprot:TRINITY_DN5750_c0_g1_i1.p1 TRINITY_DN5750_c0_g1~~TRINITY_DN5750_c0_g1_i1.p1  ORF type:complete len:206 (+),score=40.64 TRINITY_DN5750_c0_g1_i1:46-663(+)
MSLVSAILNHRCEGACAHDSCVLSVLRGFRQGAVYGAKIRFPHAFVMTFLFRDGSVREKVRAIFKATFQHSRNLAIYVSIYKFIGCLLRNIRQKQDPLNTALAGAIGGYFVFGEDNPVNMQINLYVFSRIFLGFIRTAVRHKWTETYAWAYPAFAAFTWAMVMYLFEHEGGTLQSSLISSMEYLYHDSDRFPTTMNPIRWFIESA